MNTRIALLPVLVLLAACGGGGLTRDESGAVTSGGSVSAFEVQVGDCSNAELEEETTTIALVPCVEPHSHEAYFTAEHPDGPYPGATALEVFAEQQCVGAFADYMGIEVAESRFYFTYLFPSVSTWNDKQDRQVVCFVVSRDELVTGSLKGAAA
jgi:hypothetical protein